MLVSHARLSIGSPSATQSINRMKIPVRFQSALLAAAATLVAVGVAAICLTRQGRAATLHAAPQATPVDAAICSPESGGCLDVTLHQTPRLHPVAASAGWVVVTLLDGQNAPAGTRLYSVKDGGFTAAGALPLRESTVALSGDLLYAVEDRHILHIWNLANPQRPALVEQMEVGEAAVGDLILTDAAMFLARSGGNGGLSVYSLANPRHPALARQLDADPFLRMQLEGERLYAATPRGLAVVDVEDPLAPELLSSRTWFTDVQTSTIALHVEGGVAYYMAEAMSDGRSLCRIVKIDGAGAQHAAGDCPFPPGRTTFFATRAWVNPNGSSAQFLDYRRYSLANPVAPVLEGLETIRFAHALATANALYASALDGRLLRLRSIGDGHLEIAASTWSAQELEASPVLFTGGALLLDAGVQTDTERTLQFADLTEPGGPVLRGELRSPWLGARGLRARDGQLAALRANRITFFDVRNPDAPAALGQFALPAGVEAADLGWGNGPRLYALGEGARLITIDATNPLTPTLQSAIDLPGNAELLLTVPGALYLFEEGEMTVLDTAAAGAPRFVKRIPGVPLPDAATAFGSAVYLLNDERVQILDVRDPLNPFPATSQSPFDADETPRIVRLLPVADGTLVSVAREPNALAAQSQAATATWTARVYALADPLRPRQVAAVSALPTSDVVFGNGMLVLPDLTTYALGPERRVTARFPAANTARFSPAPGITYEFVEGSFDFGVANAASSSGEVCVEDVTRASPALSPGEAVVYGAIHELRAQDCETNNTLIPRLPVGVTVTMASAESWLLWKDAHLRLDAGDGWEGWPGAANSGVALTAHLLPLRPWAVVGPPPPPQLLPAIRRAP